MIKTFTFISLLLIGSGGYVSAQTGTIQTTNGQTREVKSYSVGNQKFDINVSSVSGWNKCTVLPVKKLTFEGQKRMRLDMFCSTKQGHMVNFNCSTGVGGYEVSVPQIVSDGSYLAANGDVNSKGYFDISLACDYLRPQ